MPVYRAAWIVPIAGPPLAGGWVAVRAGRVAALGEASTVPGGRTVTDLGRVAVLPALVNAHTHLELSWLRGRVGRADGFVDWVVGMMRERTFGAGAGDVQAHRAALLAAMAEARAAGTGLVGDVSNGLDGLESLGDAGLCGVVFHELLGFQAEAAGTLLSAAQGVTGAVAARVPAGWRVCPAVHAPYSVSPALFAAVRRLCGEDGTVPTAVHVAEGQEEMDLLSHGGGRWPEILRRMGAWDAGWAAPGCGPVEYLDRLGFWAARTLAVHAVRTGPDDLERLRRRGATVVTCPRSNAYVGAGAPPVKAFYESGVRVAVGTDSLSSVEDLNVFSELAALRRLAPSVPAARLLASATIEGAYALGFDREFGSIEPGKRASLLAVRVPDPVRDVEEHLVGAIAPADIRWVEDGLPC